MHMSARLEERAKTYEGYLGIEAARNSDGTGVAAVYWTDVASIEAWARDPEHQIAKRKGRNLVFPLPDTNLPRRARLWQAGQLTCAPELRDLSVMHSGFTFDRIENVPR
jgi:hypothetical protein